MVHTEFGESVRESNSGNGSGYESSNPISSPTPEIDKVTDLCKSLNISNSEEVTDVGEVQSTFDSVFKQYLITKYNQTLQLRVKVTADVVYDGDTRAEELQGATISDLDPPVFTARSNIDAVDRPTHEPLEPIQLTDLEREVTQKLIEMGDLIELHCGDQINELLRSLHSVGSPREFLGRIARSVFREARLNWGRILVFIYFGMRFFLESAVRRVRDVLSNLVLAFTEFCNCGIFQWIADHGGWHRLVSSNRVVVGVNWALQTQGVRYSSFLLVAALGVLYYLGFKRPRV